MFWSYKWPHAGGPLHRVLVKTVSLSVNVNEGGRIRTFGYDELKWTCITNGFSITAGWEQIFMILKTFPVPNQAKI